MAVLTLISKSTAAFQKKGACWAHVPLSTVMYPPPSGHFGGADGGGDAGGKHGGGSGAEPGGKIGGGDA